jgi:hypothetical protein
MQDPNLTEEQVDQLVENKIEELKADRHAWKKKELDEVARRQVVLVPNAGPNRAQRRKRFK